MKEVSHTCIFSFLCREIISHSDYAHFYKLLDSFSLARLQNFMQFVRISREAYARSRPLMMTKDSRTYRVTRKYHRIRRRGRRDDPICIRLALARENAFRGKLFSRQHRCHADVSHEFGYPVFPHANIDAADAARETAQEKNSRDENGRARG